MELRLCSLDEPQDEQQDHRADEGHNDRGDYASAGRYPQRASKESANHSANDADDDVDDQAKSTAFYDLSRQPAGIAPITSQAKIPYSIALVREWAALWALILVVPVTSSERRLAYPSLSFD